MTLHLHTTPINDEPLCEQGLFNAHGLVACRTQEHTQNSPIIVFIVVISSVVVVLHFGSANGVHRWLVAVPYPFGISH